jgi:hypothetical protein
MNANIEILMRSLTICKINGHSKCQTTIPKINSVAIFSCIFNIAKNIRLVN